MRVEIANQVPVAGRVEPVIVPWIARRDDEGKFDAVAVAELLRALERIERRFVEPQSSHSLGLAQHELGEIVCDEVHGRVEARILQQVSAWSHLRRRRNVFSVLLPCRNAVADRARAEMELRYVFQQIKRPFLGNCVCRADKRVKEQFEKNVFQVPVDLNVLLEEGDVFGDRGGRDRGVIGWRKPRPIQRGGIHRLVNA